MLELISRKIALTVLCIVFVDIAVFIRLTVFFKRSKKYILREIFVLDLVLIIVGSVIF